jgi:pimeloyl-ACP methyl ester carboxylesterase
MSNFTDGYWLSGDGLRLHYREYVPLAPVEGRPPIICLHGLTRNARDFAALAERLAAAGWRVICPELRGRGDSGYAKSWATYQPVQYVKDLNDLLDALKVSRFVAIGTSLGGLMTLLLAIVDSSRIAAAVLNDIGPAIEPAGLARIRDYVGQGRSFPTWMHAARALEETHAAAFPDYATSDWLAMAKRVMVLGGNGRVVYDYDMKIAEPFAHQSGGGGVEPGMDLWPGLDALRGRPVLLVRGGLSDLLSPVTLAEMARRLPQAEVVELPRVGHAPTLDEPAVQVAIDRLLTQVAEPQPA